MDDILRRLLQTVNWRGRALRVSRQRTYLSCIQPHRKLRIHNSTGSYLDYSSQ